MIYLDNAATTKVAPKVIEDITEALHWYGNPSSAHEMGYKARQIVEDARKKIAESINAEPEEIIFTSGGSEANNMALKGCVNIYELSCVISTETEHPSILKTKEYLGNYTDSVYSVNIPVDSEGILCLEALKIMLQDIQDFDWGAPIVALSMANNEIGTIQPVKEIAKMVANYGGLLHIDAVQAFPHMKIDVKELGIDTMAVSGHKFGCPKGIGFLYKRKGLDLEPLIHGGHQENGLRAGTENLPYIYAMGNQVERIVYDGKKAVIAEALWKTLENLCGTHCELQLNGTQDFYNRIDRILNITFKKINADVLITLLSDRGICVSAGAACCSGEKTPSKVLKAIGLSDDDAFSTIRISWENNIEYEFLIRFAHILADCLNMCLLV